MGQIAEIICGPLIKMLEERIINNEIKRRKLQSKKKEIALVYEQIQSENEKDTEIVVSISKDESREIECSQSSDGDTILDTQPVIESVSSVDLDDLLMGNISMSDFIYALNLYQINMLIMFSFRAMRASFQCL